MDHILARKMVRQLPPRWFARFEHLLDQIGEDGRSRGGLLRVIFFQRLDGQLELSHGLLHSAIEHSVDFRL
jgi:hypothetical protein